MFKSKEIRLQPDPAVQEAHWRALSLGVRALNQAELLTLLLGGGNGRASVLAATLISRYGSLADLAALDPVQLAAERGLGTAKALRLAASFEIGARSQLAVTPTRLAVQGPADLFPVLEAELRSCDRERFLALHLDTRHRLLAMETVSVGTLNASLVHPREVFRMAVHRASAAVVVAHNHPSGCCEPSREDLELTRRLDACGRLLGIELLDHIIVGSGTSTSLRERGWPAGAGGRTEAAGAQEG